MAYVAAIEPFHGGTVAVAGRSWSPAPGYRPVLWPQRSAGKLAASGAGASPTAFGPRESITRVPNAPG